MEKKVDLIIEVCKKNGWYSQSRYANLKNLLKQDDTDIIDIADEIYYYTDDSVSIKFEDIVFKTPIELNVMYTIDKAELKTYDSKTIKGYYLKTGKLNFQILTKELEANECDIKRGDYIGIQVTPEHMEYFIVTDDGRVNYDNKHTLWGTKPYYRSISCTVVSDVNETVNL